MRIKLTARDIEVYRTVLIVTLLLLWAAFGHAQTAKVIPLSSADAKEAKDLYAQRDDILKRIDELHKKITDKYLSDEKPGSGLLSYSNGTTITSSCFLTFNSSGQTDSSCPNETAEQKKVRKEREAKEKADYEAKEKLQHHLERKPGWNDFEYSEDFKFVVPKTSVPLVNSNYGYGTGCCGGLFTNSNCIIPSGTIYGATAVPLFGTYN